MNYIIKDTLIDELQETACAIMYATETLSDILHDAMALIDEIPEQYSKERILGQLDAIRILAKHLDLSAVETLH